MKLKILVTAGDGIGPEVTNEAVAVLREVAELGGHDFTFTERRIGGVAIVQDGTPLPADTLNEALGERRSSARRRGRQRIQFPSSRQASRSRPACNFAPRSAASPICALRSRSRNSRSTARSGPRSSKAPTFCSCANCSAASTSAQPREWNKTNRRSVEHHALHARRSGARGAHRIQACARSAARNSPASTRPTCSRSRSCGARP